MFTIFVENQRLKLDRSQLIQSGGEGMVFAMGKHAIKIYHQPSPAHEAKLKDWLTGDLKRRLPANLLGPQQLVFDQLRQVVGFQMPRLPKCSQPFKKLSQPNLDPQSDLTLLDVVKMFQEIHLTLSQIHEQGVVVGDLNDTNLFFSPAAGNGLDPFPRIHWIDIDSYQFGPHPCPVAKEAFLDPQLYGMMPLGLAGYFSARSDWYAYFTLLIKSLLRVHPYGGVHHQYKTIQARSQAGLSILSTAIKYPPKARPRECLSDELLHHIHLVYEKGQRQPFPRQLLEQYADSLVSCNHCGLSYPMQRRKCPGCQERPPNIRQPAKPAIWQERLLLEADGSICHVTILPDGRIAAILHQGGDYLLVRAGKSGILDTSRLSAGRSNYRFDSFAAPDGRHCLVVNSPGEQQLLLLDVAGPTPQLLQTLETALFCEEAVFATTTRHLYRLASNWIMRGTIQNGAYVEEAIATAHRAQTTFWGSPVSDVIAGYHRVFAELRFFLIDADKVSYSIALPTLTLGEAVSDIDLAFTRSSLAIMWLITRHGRSRVETWISDLQGAILQHFNQTASELNHPHHLAKQYPYTIEPDHTMPPFIQLPPQLRLDGSTGCWSHPGGLLIQRSNHLYLIEKG